MSRLRGALRLAFSWWLTLPAVLRIAAPVAIMVVLWVMSSAPPARQQGTALRALLHNCAHIVAYFTLSGAWTMALLGRSRVPGAGASSRIAVASVLLSVGYALVDEWHQSFVPGRSCSLWDVLSDACGSAVAAAFLWWAFTGRARFAVRTGWLLGVGLSCAMAGTFL